MKSFLVRAGWPSSPCGGSLNHQAASTIFSWSVQMCRARQAQKDSEAQSRLQRYVIAISVPDIAPNTSKRHNGLGPRKHIRTLTTYSHRKWVPYILPKKQRQARMPGGRPVIIMSTEPPSFGSLIRFQAHRFARVRGFAWLKLQELEVVKCTDTLGLRLGKHATPAYRHTGGFHTNQRPRTARHALVISLKSAQ